jgi:uncharacterized protein YndB with AHSA1/START domain
MEFIRKDIRPGGKAFYMMEPDSSGAPGSAHPFKMYGRVEYLELARPHRLVYLQQFCDEKENLSRHPAVPTWPATMLTTVEFTAEGESQTRVTVTWEVRGDATREERETFAQMRGGMTQGWTGSFDKLESYLESRA